MDGLGVAPPQFDPPPQGMTQVPPLVWLAVVLVSPLVAWGVVAMGKPLGAQGGWHLLWALVGSPLLEEWVYRAAIQQPLAARLALRFPVHAGHGANVLTATLFVAVHSPAHGVWALAWGLPGWVLGELFRQTQRVWPCVLLHAWFNVSLWGVGLLNA